MRLYQLVATLVSCCLLWASTSQATTFLGGDVLAAAPLVMAWSRDVPLALGQTVQEVFVVPAPSQPGLVIVELVGPDTDYTTLVGLVLADGRPLWRSEGIKTEYNDHNYTLPFWRVGSLRVDALVADYHLTTATLLWRGFALFDPKTAKLMVAYDTDGTYSNTAQLSRWGFLYMIRNQDNGRAKDLIRLQAPDYSPDRPAAVFTFPLAGPPGSIQLNLRLAQRRGLLFNTYVNELGNITLQRLDPASLKPVWTRTDLQEGEVDVVEPAEELVVVARASGDGAGGAWTTQLDAYAVADGSLRSRWLVKWRDTLAKNVRMQYVGAALNRSSGEQRLCVTFISWPYDWFTCVDPLTNRVTLNISLETVASVLTMYDSWVLLKDKSGTLLAVDCFGGNNINSSLPTPSWTLTNQNDLQRLIPSEDGLSFLVAVYLVASPSGTVS